LHESLANEIEGDSNNENVRDDKARSKRRSIHAPNLTYKLSTAEERRLNQFGSAGLVWCGKQRQIRQGLSHYATLERQLIHTAFS